MQCTVNVENDGDEGDGSGATSDTARNKRSSQ
jgi:hypothetical protein